MIAVRGVAVDAPLFPPSVERRARGISRIFLRSGRGAARTYDRLREALPTRDLDAAANALSELMQVVPSRWKRVLALSRVLPTLGSKDADNIAVSLVGAASKAAAEKLEKGSGNGLCESSVALLRWSTSQAFIFSDFSRRVAKIRARLDTIPFLNEPSATQFYVLGLVVEHQARMAIRSFAQGSRDKAFVDPYSISASTLESPFMGPRVSIPAAYESIAEAVELIIRFVQHRNRADANDVPALNRSPFTEPDLTLLLALADMWAGLREDWERVHHQDWYLEFDADVDICSPPGRAEFACSRVAQIREHSLRVEHAAYVKRLGRGEYTDTPSNVDLLARSMSVPSSTAWDCKFDLAALRIAAINTEWVAHAKSWIALRHYHPLTANRKVDWSVWLRLRELLVLVCRAYRRAVDLSGCDITSDSGVVATTPMLDRSVLLGQLAEVHGASPDMLARAFEVHVFDRNRRSLELWDQPLIPIGGDRILLVPGLVIPSDPARALENMAVEWAPELFSNRGPSYERVVEFLGAAQIPGKTVRDVRFDAHDGRSVEFDLIIHWEGWLLLIEAKCVKSVHTPYEEAVAADVVDEAVDQLRRRLRVLQADWHLLREHAKTAELPETPPPRERIIPIVLLNILTFTGMGTPDGVVITDDFCFYRYFGGAIEKFLMSPDGSTGRIGTLDGIPEVPGSPAEFLAYLRDPPQVRGIAARLSVAYREVIRVDDDDPKVAYFDLESAGPPSIEGGDGV